MSIESGIFAFTFGTELLHILREQITFEDILMAAVFLYLLPLVLIALVNHRVATWPQLAQNRQFLYVAVILMASFLTPHAASTVLVAFFTMFELELLIRLGWKCSPRKEH